MSKAVLVMDMPSSCEDCILRNEGACFPVSKQNSICGVYYIIKEGRRAAWCPLREFPKKKNSMNLNSIMEKCKDRDSIMDSILKQFITHGYNACIDELLKGEEG